MEQNIDLQEVISRLNAKIDEFTDIRDKLTLVVSQMRQTRNRLERQAESINYLAGLADDELVSLLEQATQLTAQMALEKVSKASKSRRKTRSTRGRKRRKTKLAFPPLARSMVLTLISDEKPPRTIEGLMERTWGKDWGSRTLNIRQGKTNTAVPYADDIKREPSSLMNQLRAGVEIARLVSEEGAPAGVMVDVAVHTAANRLKQIDSGTFQTTLVRLGILPSP